MNTKLNNVIVENQKAADKNIKTLDDVIAAMDRINAKYDKPATIKTVDDIIPVMDEIQARWNNGKK
jgi:CRISPR/Cas system-associated endonuclease Cas3-HD